GQGWLYCAVVLDVYSRRVVGWSIADHLHTELVVDALDMARWQPKPPAGGTVLQSDDGCTVHVLGLRPAAPRRRAARLDGLGRRLLRQRAGRIVLQPPATRVARHTHRGHPAGPRQRDLRMDRSLVHPPPPSLSPGLSQPRQLRKDAPKTAHRGSMITTA